jgi:hypothetical protein
VPGGTDYLRTAETLDELSNDVELMHLLRMAGETPIGEISPDAVKQFWPKVFWNGSFVLIPLYVTAPVIALCTYVLV